MTIKGRAKQLFDYISHVYSIDLPVTRDVTNYRAELWWQSELAASSQCVIRGFESATDDTGDGNASVALTQPEPWLSVLKRPIENPPEPPSAIRDWLALAANPEVPPQPKPSILKREKFTDSRARVEAFRTFAVRWKSVAPSERATTVPVPTILMGWVDANERGEDIKPAAERETEERFGDDPRRAMFLTEYVDKPWKRWAERMTPFFRANALYDELYALHQRLSVEGDRIEILWGHLLLAWDYRPDTRVLHPLFLTPLNLEFDPQRRNIRLVASSSQPTKIDLDCLRDLDYPNKDKLLAYARKLNDDDSPPDVWSHGQMRAVSNTFTGLLSSEAAEVTNRYTDTPTGKPPLSTYPVVFNAPAIIVRQRARHFWIDDAKNVAAAIERGEDIPPFIRALAGDSEELSTDEPSKSSPADTDEDGGELFFPLEYNDQQREIWDKIQNHFGVLVQGPPGTGKSHTIANIISSLLARGKRVLVTSQTENALKVLRNLVPEDIRELCISQLGNDIESKTQLNQAVQAIGKRLADKASDAPEQRVRRIRQELRAVREEQAALRNHIREWAEVDSAKANLAGRVITAEQAAKEYAAAENASTWLKDRLALNTEPPLTDAELIDLCELLKEISAEEQANASMYLPEGIEPPEPLSRCFAYLKAAADIAGETEDARLQWRDALRQADEEQLAKVILVLEEAIRGLRELTETWQHSVLALIAADPKNASFWENFLKTCENHHSVAFEAFQKSQTFDIQVVELPQDIDVDVAFAALEKVLERGKNPKSLLVWPFLHKSAKGLFRAVTADGRPISTPERLSAAKSYFIHIERMAKFEKYWRKNLDPVSGPVADVSAPMPVADAKERIKKVAHVIQWASDHLQKIREHTAEIGCPANHRQFHCEDGLTTLLRIVHGQQAALQVDHLASSLAAYEAALRKEGSKANAHPLWADFSRAVSRRTAWEYEEAWRCLQSLLIIRPKAQRIRDYSQRLADAAPLWAAELIEYARKSGPTAIPANWRTAWQTRQLGSWLDQLHNREPIENLQTQLDRCRRREHGLITRLVHERTWQRQIRNVRSTQHQALATWADAIRKYGKGTGKYAPYWLNVAARAMRVAQGAVPVWIMPLFRVVELFAAEPGIFDVVIVDEASQCDIRSLPVLFRGKKILVVGDPEQISPASVGVPYDKVMEQIRVWLNGIPYPERFFINNSLYTITGTLPHMDRTLLSEHFRCVPEIIEFNNHLCPTYGGSLEPLRQPNPESRLEPSINTIQVETGFKSNTDVNEPEAEALVSKLVECCRDPRYSTGGKDGRKRTMGVISLLGEAQAKHISELIAQRLDENEREERRIICGDAYTFQGDERDVMFLSMVIATNAPFGALVKDDARQRFNVATSRARDQVFLFHSVRLSEIQNPDCVRYRLLSWYQNPPLARMQAGLQSLKEKAESQFEIDVGEMIIKQGYRVLTQLSPFPRGVQYRIDIVVQGEKDRLAVECDGDRWHGPERWEYDQRREEQLRRAGWSFWRVSSSAFYRDREKALSPLWERLDDLGITPEEQWGSGRQCPSNPSVQLDLAKSKPVVMETTVPKKAPPETAAADEDSPVRLSAALAYARKKTVDVRELSIAEIQQILVGILKRGRRPSLTRETAVDCVCNELLLRPTGRSKVMLSQKVERALQHLIDRELLETDELGNVRFAFGNHSSRQDELNLDGKKRS